MVGVTKLTELAGLAIPAIMALLLMSVSSREFVFGRPTHREIQISWSIKFACRLLDMHMYSHIDSSSKKFASVRLTLPDPLCIKDSS